ncbi:MAG: flagellar protein FlaG [bacterium]
MDIQGIASLNQDKTVVSSKSLKEPITASEERTLQKNEGNTEESISIDKQRIIAESIGIELSSASITFTKDKATDEVIIKIVDSETKEVIKQIPPEEIMKLKRFLTELQGILLDKKA